MTCARSDASARSGQPVFGSNSIRLAATAFCAIALATILVGFAHARTLNETEAETIYREIERSRGTEEIATLQTLRLTLDGAEAALVLFEESEQESLRILRLTKHTADVTSVARAALHVTAREMLREIGIENQGDVSASDSPGTESTECRAVLANILQLPATQALRLYIAPPAALASCPFELLQTPDPPPAPVSYVPNGSCLVSLSQPRLWSGAALVAFTDLPVSSSGAERVRGAGAAIGVSRGEPRIYKGEAAAMPALRSIGAEKPVVLHLDLVAGTDGITLNGVPASEEQTLPLDAIGTMGLTTDLTLISQTDASLGSVGQVPIALLRGGSRSVIVPRWPVDPRAAETFLDHFYEGLFDALPRDKAMQNARAALAASGAPLTEQLAFMHWGAGNLPVYLVAQKGNPFPLLVAWLLFLPPVIVSVVWLRRRYLRRLAEQTPARR